MTAFTVESAVSDGFVKRHQVKRDTKQLRGVYNTYYNSHFNTGLTVKKVEALFHRVLKELSEMRDEIRSSKGNKTAGKYPKYTVLKSANDPKNSIPKRFRKVVSLT